MLHTEIIKKLEFLNTKKEVSGENVGKQMEAIGKHFYRENYIEGSTR